MITLIYDVAANTLKLQTSTPVKAAGDLRVMILTSEAVDEESVWKLALHDGQNTPAVLAYTEAFTQENAALWSGLLDMTDTRLAAYIAANGTIAVNLELAATIDGEQRPLPNIALTVQPAAITGPQLSDGGPHYYTQGEVDAAIVTAVGTSQHGGQAIPNGQSYVDVTFGHAFPDTTWYAAALSVRNTADSTPLNLFPTLMTARTAAGFRMQLNGAADSANYTLDFLCRRDS